MNTSLHAHLGRGFGLITSSSFYVPQVNLPASMAAFVPPAAVVFPPSPRGGAGDARNTWNAGLNSARKVAPMLPFLSAAGLGQSASPAAPNLTGWAGWLPLLVIAGVLIAAGD
jgi:hypothetical protein